MLGLVQVGQHAMADRYSYLTQIGLYVALAWGAAQAVVFWPGRRWMWGVASASLLALLMGCAWRQTSFWRDSEILWTHALACASDNFMAHNNLGNALADQGRLAEAIAHYEETLRIQPGYVEAYNNLGVIFGAQGRLDEAISRFQSSLSINPDNAETHNNLGYALAARGRLAEAIRQHHQALEIKSDFTSAHRNLGNALAASGRFDEAMVHYQKTLEMHPEDVLTHYNFGRILGGTVQVSGGRRALSESCGNGASRRDGPYRAGLVAGNVCRSIVAERCRGRGTCPGGEDFPAAGGRKFSMSWLPPMPKPGGFRKPWPPPAKP